MNEIGFTDSKMIKFNKKYQYDNRMDPEVIDLCDAMNSLPGIKTDESCCGHGKSSLNMWFYVGDRKEGLFFLTRCVDNRYWKYGHLWKIELLVGDNFENNELPIVYRLHSGSVIVDEAYDQARDLVENMNDHLNHKNFMNLYNLNIDDFDI